MACGFCTTTPVNPCPVCTVAPVDNVKIRRVRGKAPARPAIARAAPTPTPKAPPAPVARPAPAQAASGPLPCDLIEWREPGSAEVDRCVKLFALNDLELGARVLNSLSNPLHRRARLDVLTLIERNAAIRGFVSDADLRTRAMIIKACRAECVARWGFDPTQGIRPVPPPPMTPPPRATVVQFPDPSTAPTIIEMRAVAAPVKGIPIADVLPGGSQADWDDLKRQVERGQLSPELAKEIGASWARLSDLLN